MNIFLEVAGQLLAAMAVGFAAGYVTKIWRRFLESV